MLEYNVSGPNWQPHSTPLLQDWLGDDAAKRHRREVHFPTGRFGEAIEQAHAVVFLASDESSFVNGTDFVVDGGLTKVTFFSPSYIFFLRTTMELQPKARNLDLTNNFGEQIGVCHPWRSTNTGPIEFCK